MTELIVQIARDAALHGLGTFETTDPAQRNIFWGNMPEGINEGLLLVDAVSPAPLQYIDHEFLIIEFWAKSAHSDRAKALMRQVYNLYHRRYSYDVGEWHVFWSRALGGIVDADRDIENSKLVRLSVQFLCRNTNNIS